MSAIITLSVLGILVLYLGIFNFKKVLLPVILLGLTVAFVLLATNTGNVLAADMHMLVFDAPARAFGCLLILITAGVFCLTPGNMEYATKFRQDVFGLMIFSLIGGIMMISYGNLITLFLGIETLSIPLYVMVGSKRSDLKSNEAAMKYFLLGAFATGFLLLGIALIYGATGSFDFRVIAEQCLTLQGNVSSWFEIGVLLLLIGLSFKVSAAPFHFWAPDVYDGAPTIVTTYMSTVVKIAGFGALVRFTRGGFPDMHVFGQFTFILAILTMTIGNFVATQQKSIKRMLAYSSIAHAGYMLIAIHCSTNASLVNIFIYAFAYSLASLVMFGVFMAIADKYELADIDSFNGLSKKNPLVAICAAIALLSMAGIPITAGFFGKYYIFASAIDSNYFLIVIIAMLNSLVSLYYYLKLIIAMFFKEGSNDVSEKIPALHYFVIFGCTALNILIGLYPNNLMMLF
ncbi:MAG: NADH-quinone oxidoreductase subunit N [Chitinophagales bacterium]|nr:NADH-quinone oxidoreductase subunit N [Chitinophagales bacterium]